MAHINSDILRLGVDVGSTTVKAVALDPADNSVLFTRYQRHNAHQAGSCWRRRPVTFPACGSVSACAGPADGPLPPPWGSQRAP